MIVQHSNVELRRLYHVWRQIVCRCTDPLHPRYADYGGRGIAVCEAWRSFETFWIDMAPRPPGLTLERIDNGKGYDAINCRWTTYSAQALNRRLSTPYRGVSRCGRKWRAQFERNSVKRYLGLYDSPAAAAAAYDQAAQAWAQEQACRQ